MSLTIIPHLSFQGNCEEAVHTWITAFGGEILYLSRWTEETCERPEQAGRVMHVEFLLGETRMAASDAMDGKPVTGVKWMMHMDSLPQAQQAVNLLAEGGEVLSPLRPHPAPDDGGCGCVLQDRFGHRWIITCPNPAKA